MSIKFHKNSKKISEEIRKIILQKFEERLKQVAKLIREDIIKENISIWKKTETYYSLIDGDLTHEFGIHKGTAEQRVHKILDIFGQSISVVPLVNYRKRSSTGGYVTMNINVFSKNIDESIFSSPEANVVTEKTAPNDMSDVFGAFGATEAKQELPWLRWLLYEGNRYIIYGYEYEDIVSPRSRSGKGLMVHSEGAWKVPAKFSGTKNSHWIIRALKDNREFLASQYGTIIQRYI